MSGAAGRRHPRLAGRAARGARAGDDGRGGKALRLELELEQGDHHDLVLVLALDGKEPRRRIADARVVGDRGGLARARPRARADGRARATRATPTPSSRGSRALAAAWSQQRPCRCPSAPEKGATTTTATSGSATSATRGRRSRRPAPHPLLDDAVRFVRDRLLDDGPQLMPAYTTSGGRVPDERSARPARVSRRHATSSATGSTSSSSSTPSARRCCCSPPPPRTTASTPTAGAPPRSRPRRSRTRWHEPDAGIWELEPDEWTHSRLICAAGLRAISACATRRRAGRQLARARRRDHRRHLGCDACTHPGAGSAPRGPAPRRSAAAAGDPRRDPRTTTRARSRRCTRSRES